MKWREEDKIVPWWAPKALEYVESLLSKDMVVFEWGSGRSTVWLADRVAKVYSVEHQLKWKNLVEKFLGDRKNVTLFHKQYLNWVNPGGAALDYNKHKEYVDVVHEVGEQVDVLFVDGRNRVKCVEHGYKYLKLGGMLVLDDSHRGRYRKVTRVLFDKLKYKAFRGGPRNEQTAVFHKDSEVDLFEGSNE